MKSRHKAYSVLAMIVLAQTNLFAQQKNIDTIQVNVVTKFKPVIADASKLNSNPTIADTVKLVKKVDYNVLYSQYPTSYTPGTIGAIQLKGEPLDKLYHSLLCAGGGNYNTLYAEYFFNSIRSKDADYGIHFNHLSSDATLSNSGYSGYSYNDVNLFGEKLFGEHALSARADFDEHVVHDYGYNIAENQISDNTTTRERFDLFSGAVKLESKYSDSSKINHAINVGYSNYGDLYNSSENNFDGGLKLYTWFNRQRIDLNGQVEYYGEQNRMTSFNTTDILVNPAFSTHEKHWDAHLGLNAYLETGGSKINLYPDLIARFHVVQDVLMIFAGIDGKEYFDSYHLLSAMNPYVQDTLNMKYTQIQYHVFAGIAGNLSSNITYNLEASQSEIKNMPLFVTDTLEQLKNRFAVIYDNIKVLNIHGDIDYKLKNDFSILLGANYFQYTPTNQLKAWYNPGLKINLSIRYTIEDKYTLKADLFYIGSQYAPQMQNGVISAKTLAGYPDLNLGLDYKFNRTFSAFLHLNNLANVTYYQWDNYPMQKFNIMLGIRIGF